MNRLPYSSNDKLGSQHMAPRLSLLPMILPLQVEPPSKLTASNMPAAGTTTLLMITMLLGLVGLTATASSDSLLWSWLTSIFLGVAGGVASAGATSRAVVNATRANRTMSDFNFTETSDGIQKWAST